jgi:hypothetical protein
MHILISVLGIDNFNPYYDVGLKRARLQGLMRFPAFRFVERDIGDRQAMHYNIGSERPVKLMHFIEVLQQALGTKAQLKMLPVEVGGRVLVRGAHAA